MTQASPTYLPRLQAIARRGLPSLQVLLVVQVGVYALTTVGPREGFDPLLDGWLRGSAYDRGPVSGPARSARHLGVPTMLERAEFIGGSCTVEPGDAGGTVVTLRFPARDGARRRALPHVAPAAYALAA